MKKYNISKPEKYMKDGVEKTAWKNVGEMVEFEKQDGTVSRIIEIPAIGLKANVFEIQPKQPVAQATQSPQFTPAMATKPPLEYPEEEINPDDIPFN